MDNGSSALEPSFEQCNSFGRCDHVIIGARFHTKNFGVDDNFSTRDDVGRREFLQKLRARCLDEVKMDQEISSAKNVRKTSLLNGLKLLLQHIDILCKVVDCLGEVGKPIEDANERLCDNPSGADADALGKPNYLSFLVSSIRLDDDAGCCK